MLHVTIPLLAREVYKLTRSFGGTSAVYVENLATGAGASWNARATFPAASSLKLAIAVTALARTEGTPRVGLDARPASPSDADVLRQRGSECDRAVLRRLDVGRLRARQLADALDRARRHGDVRRLHARLGRRPSQRSLAGPIPLRVDSQPSWGYGKKTSAYDLAALLRAVWVAGGGKGPLRAAQPGFTATDARYLLYLLAHVRDPGKLDREVGRMPGVRVLHKAGWINDARHDNGIVFWRGGAYVVTVMTYRGAGVGVSSDVLAGRVASAALRRFRG